MNRVSWILLLIPVLAAAQVKLTVNAIDSSAGNVECYMIETDDAIWYLEKDGAGLSSLVDRDGNDWLGFHPEPVLPVSTGDSPMPFISRTAVSSIR